MSKKKKARRKSQTPPLSLPDKCIYGVGFLLVIAIFIGILTFYFGFPHRFALQDSFVIATDERVTSFWCFPFWIYTVLSLLAFVAGPCTMKKPIFGNPKITYGPPHWESVYPLFGKQRKKKKTSQKEKNVTATLFFGWFAIFFVFFLLSLFSLFGRNTLMQNGDITVYSVFNQEKRTYTTMDVSALEIRTDYSSSRTGRRYWYTEYEFTMTDGRTYEFEDSCFRSYKDAFEGMIKMKTLIDSRKITITDIDNLKKVIDDHDCTPEEIELLYKLFEVSSE